ncbi:MAG: type II toxin-antitoxin system RatA family toxin [Alphaproteobacteria bacterium]|nr:type II toxin-antitoxin system RatA family toxin [Alphaproteobacteria bacterium]
MPTHAEKRLLPYSAVQVYDMVSDIERYPEFLPWCVAARIRRRDGNVLYADLSIGFRMVRETFTSRVTLDPGRGVDVTYLDGPFHHLNNHWRFTDQPEGGCLVDFYVDFEFRSALLRRLIGSLFNEAVRRLVHAFETRAGQLYGATPSPRGRG